MMTIDDGEKPTRKRRRRKLMVGEVVECDVVEAVEIMSGHRDGEFNLMPCLPLVSSYLFLMHVLGCLFVFRTNSYGVSVPESLILFIAYHTVAPHHAVRGPCGEARAYPGDLAERVNSGTNPGDLAENLNSGTNPGDLAEMFGLARHVHLGGCSGGQSPVSTASPHRRVSKMVEDLPQPGSANSWRYLVFLGECRGVGIITNRDLFMASFQVVFEPVSRDADWMDLGDLRGMPKMSGGKAPSTRAIAPAREVGVSPTREAPKASSKRPIDAPTEQVDDPARRHKKVKVLMRRHKSRHSEGESRSHPKGKEPAAPSEELETPVESDEGGASSVHHRPRSMKDLFKTKVHKDDAGYYTLQMSDLGHQDPDKEMKARWRGLNNSMKQELDALKSGGGPEAVAKAEERVSELEQELKKTKRERDKALQRLEASEKELSEVRSNLVEIQRLLKEARVKARKMDDELLQAVKALENARAELPR
ncbi:hypothetical protein B296_00052967 [Ensete ventricosum]|uniref:Uncharacterized protein n=1 Tax=Ensete ventricosum TaxID=4639 RepID=A0A426X474_ENSVE|nr:hypothetical protein B296_00052967 [Ensete ventricosum]